MRKRKSSLHVTLVLIGAAGLAGCGRSDQPEMRRDVYASLADCRADWDREENCEAVPRTSGATGTTSGSHYYGPRYYSSGSSSGFSSPHRTSRSIGTHTVSRGGFGSSSSFHSSGS